MRPTPAFLSRRRFLTLSAAAGLSALGCNADGTATSAATNKGTDAGAGTGMPVDAGPTVDTTALVAGNTAFALDLYGQLRKEPGAVFFSPFSISTALGMTAAGAKGETLDEMTKALHLPADPHPQFASLIRSVNGGPGRGFELVTANALWGMKGYPWRPEFLDLTRKNYGAGLVETDFAQSEAARQQINGWVAETTKQKIRDLIGPNVLTALTRLVLTNAIYFKGNWASQFKKEATKNEPFTRADGTKADVPLMHQEKRFGYAEADDLQVLHLPYVGEELGMLVVLPRKPDGLAKVEESLTADRLAGWVKALQPEKVRTYLPRFKAETEYGLIPPLTALGMKAAFTPAADLTGMHSSPEKVYVTHVIHKAFVDVNEEGTEAAAATGVVASKAPSPPPPQPKVFRADRPFLFAIRDNRTGNVLFLGRYTGPK